MVLERLVHGRDLRGETGDELGLVPPADVQLLDPLGKPSAAGADFDLGVGKRALRLHLLAEGIGDVDVEAFQLAVRRQVVEGRIGALGADLESRLLGVGHAENRHRGSGRERETQ